MTTTSHAATPPNALRAHVVAPGDPYATRGDRCARCQRAVIPCDVIATSQHSPAITHVACLTQRAASAITAALPAAATCWYTDSRTLHPCPLPSEAHNLCAAHHTQLCCEPKKPARRKVAP